LVLFFNTYTPEVKTTNKAVFFLAEVGFLVPWWWEHPAAPAHGASSVAQAGMFVASVVLEILQLQEVPDGHALHGKGGVRHAATSCG
jgi:hypothetical protein